VTVPGNDAAPISISDLVRRAARTKPDAVALVDDPNQLTWAQLDARATSAALALRDAGLEDGDRVVLQLATGLDFVAFYLGAGRAGLIAVPVNPACTAPELRHVLDDCGARLLVTPETVPSGVAGTDPHRDRTGEDVAVLLYTSGTSGRPKGAMLSSRALLANLAQMAAVEPPLITGEDVMFLPLPLFHVFGLNAGLGMALFAGATTVLAERFDAAQALYAMAAHRVSVVMGAPGMFAQWVGHEMGAVFASVRYALSGSAPLPPALAREYDARDITLYQGYGLTEAAPAVTLNRSGKPGSIGAPLPGVEIERRDADGSRVAEDDDPGELFVRGPNLFSGYWPSGEGGPDADGWFGTGDIAVRDDDGDLCLVGHSSELVLVNGFNVYPAEVESVLGVQPGVAEVAVVGVDDPKTGEAVVAYVVPAAGAALDPEQLVGAASRSLAKFKLPRDVEIVDALPRTATGKVMKWRLRTTR
jgi:long-chain acyl-CoA synthetase